MDGRTKTVVILVLLAIIGVGGYLYIQDQEPEAQSVLSFDKINVANTEDVGWQEWEGGWYKEKVSGEWVAHVRIDQPDTIDLVDKAETDAPDSEYGDGAKFKVKKKVRITTEPRPAYFFGSVRVHGWSYSDAGQTNYERVFPWYRLNDWEGVIVPYNLKVQTGTTESMETITDKNIVVGPRHYEDASPHARAITNDGTITMRDMAITSMGGSEPPTDLALVWTDSGTKKVLKHSSVMDKMRQEVYEEPWFSYDKVDEWSEFISNVGLGSIYEESVLSKRTFEAEIHGDRPDTYIGSGSEEPPQKLHWTYVPHDDEDGYRETKYGKEEMNGTNIDDLLDTEGYFSDLGLWEHGERPESFYWLMQTKDEDEFSTEVTINADAEVFDTVVWLPPDGDPKITETSDLNMSDQSQAQLIVKVVNEGDTPDTFNGSLELPSGLRSQGGDTSKTVDPGEEELFTFNIEASTGEDLEDEGSVTIKSEETLESDSSNFSVSVDHDDGNGDGPTGQGTVSGRVVDGETGEPVEGANALISGATSVTDSNGEYKLESVPAGTAELEIYASGYRTHSQTIQVEQDDVNNVPTIELQDKGTGIPLTTIVVIVGMVLMVSGILYYYRDRI